MDKKGSDNGDHPIRELYQLITNTAVFSYIIYNAEAEHLWAVNSIIRNNKGEWINPINYSKYTSEIPKDMKSYGRFMWKTSRGNWAIVDGFFPEKSVFDISNSVMN